MERGSVIKANYDRETGRLVLDLTEAEARALGELLRQFIDFPLRDMGRDIAQAVDHPNGDGAARS